ncbi:MAG: lipopolysaccharide biosynthesis protein RfbH [Alphaproteobacteria bacterium]|nr:lipopolysaccharide biosynthesis protein RfbH [Alphaproteobacteria bacterium]
MSVRAKLNHLAELNEDFAAEVAAEADGGARLKARILHLVERYAALAHAPQPFVPGQSPVPVSGKVYGAPELRLLTESALEFWLTTGRFNDSFERELARRLKARRVLSVNSGSSANLLAVTALTTDLAGDRPLRPGDEIITCATGFPTTVNPILQNGLVPVFVDVEIPTYNIDVRQLEAALSPRTRGIVLAHALGNPFDLASITAFARAHDLFLVEDCCDALGATYGGQPVGSFGDVGTLSFYPAHHITTGEGGAVFTRNARLGRALESLRDWGRDCWCPPGSDNTCKNRFGWQLGSLPEGYDHKYTYAHLGYNLKMTDLQAAVGVAQLDRLDDFIAARAENFAHLHEGLRELEDVFVLPEATANSVPSWFGFALTLREGAGLAREPLLARLNEERIGTRLLFGGNLVRQPYMEGRAFRQVGALAGADRVMRDTFWIGLYPGLTTAHLDHTLAVLRDHVIRTRRPQRPSLARRVETVRPQPMFEILSQARALEAAGEDIVHLEIGDTAGFRNDRFLALLREHTRADAMGYAPSAGLPELRAAIAAVHAGETGTWLSPESVVVSPANALISQVFEAVADSGTRVLVPDPGFPTYRLAATRLGLEPVPYRLSSERGWNPDPEKLLRLVRDTEDLRAIVLNSPSNPLGVTLDPDIVEAVLSAAEGRGIWAILDETYKNLVYEGYHRPARPGPNIVRLTSYSKDAAVPGLRLGSLLAPEPLARAVSDQLSLVWSCLPVPPQRALAAYLAEGQPFHAEIRTEMKARIAAAEAVLGGIPGLGWCRPHAAFYLFADISAFEADADAFAARLLTEARVAVCPGTGFGAEGAGHVRLSLAGTRAALDKGLARIAGHLSACGRVANG